MTGPEEAQPQADTMNNNSITKIAAVFSLPLLPGIKLTLPGPIIITAVLLFRKSRPLDGAPDSLPRARNGAAGFGQFLDHRLQFIGQWRIGSQQVLRGRHGGLGLAQSPGGPIQHGSPIGEQCPY